MPARPTAARRAWTVRAKVLATVLALTALGLLVAGIVTYGLQRDRTDQRIDDTLTRAFELVRTLEETPPPDATDTRSLLEHAVRQNVPAPSEGIIAFVDGRAAWYAASEVPVRLEDDPELVAVLSTAHRDASARLRTVSTELAEYRVATVPVRVAGDPATGLYAAAVVRDIELASLAATWRTFAAVSITALALVGLAGWLVTGRLLRPLRALTDTARRVGDRDLTARIPVAGDDDVADLARAFNGMLDRLEAAFVGQRRLLDDVGHELRTPLTIVGGHLEVLDPADQADVTATRELALDEVDRMRRLVDDLLTLAGADRPDFVRPEPTDVGVLTDETLDKARALGDRRWRVDARADAVATLDAQRVTQAWLQLASNAVKFSEPGTTVALGSAMRDGQLRLWVRDEGRGIAPEDAERILSRFGRAPSVVAAGIEGSGLGLAIAAAIAAAHGGTVDVVSRPEAGATVALELPVPAAPEEEVEV